MKRITELKHYYPCTLISFELESSLSASYLFAVISLKEKKKNTGKKLNYDFHKLSNGAERRYECLLP